MSPYSRRSLGKRGRIKMKKNGGKYRNWRILTWQFLWVGVGWQSRRLTGVYDDRGWCRGTRMWQVQESPTVWLGGGLRAVLVETTGRGPRLEGLPVDGTCSVFFIFPLRHPHLFKGVQRRQDGAAAERTRWFSQMSSVASNEVNSELWGLNSYPIHVE